MQTEISEIDWIAVEQGKSALQAWGIKDNRPVAHAHEFLKGPDAQELAEPALLRLIGKWLGPQPALTIICGATGVQCCAVPAAPGALRPVQLPISDARLQAFALPGLIQPNPLDIMHSDCTRIAGFLALNTGWDGIICQPGPQTSWALVSAGEVVSFQTFLTLSMTKVLAVELSLPVQINPSRWNADEFNIAVDNAITRPERMAASLAALRLRAPVRDLPDDMAQARLWGALIGAELAAARPYWLGQQLAVIGPADISGPYCQALERQGVPVTVADSDQITLAGLKSAQRLLAKGRG